MTQKRQNWNLFIGLTMLGLSALSAYASAESGSSNCEEQVKAKASEREGESSQAAKRAFAQKALLKCSEAQVGLQLDNLFGKHSMESLSEKEARCQASVRFALENRIETSGRSREELESLCLRLPSEHSASCGFPSREDEYFVLEGQKCVSKATGIVTTQRLAKSEPQRPGPQIPDPEQPDERDTDDGNGTSAQ